MLHTISQRWTVPCALLSLVLAGCGPSANVQTSQAEPEVPTAPAIELASAQSPAGEATEGAAPETFQVKFETTKGDFVVAVTRAWSPNGADRFYELVKMGFYDDCKFFRVVPDFMVQFGINGDPQIMDKWRDANIDDDRLPRGKAKSNTRGMVTFAKAGFPNSRSTQVFVNYKDNSFLDGQGFTPFGEVTSGMDVVEAINSEYGERPDQSQVQSKGNKYLNGVFPNLDGIKSAKIVEDAPAAE